MSRVQLLEPLLTTRAVAEVLGVAPHTLNVWRMTNSELPFVRVGRMIRYRPEDVRAYVARHRVAQ